MQHTIHYSHTQLQDAAEYLWQNNPYIKLWPDRPASPKAVYDIIRAEAIRHARRNCAAIEYELQTGKLSPDWVGSTGTGGYYIIFTTDMQVGEHGIVVNFDVLISPALGKEHVYVTELIDNTPD
jgi:hypothetical protein